MQLRTLVFAAGMSALVAMAAWGAGDAIVRESFDATTGELPAGWRPIQGKWTIRDGALIGEGAEARILFGDEGWQNYELEATASFLAVRDDARWFSLIFRAPDKDAAPWMQATVRFKATARNGAEFAVRTADGWSVRQTARAKTDCALDQPRQLRVVVSGSSVAIHLDGQSLVETAFALDRTHGCVGLGLSGATVRFDDIAVRRLPDTPPLPDAPAQPCEIVGHRGWSEVYPENTAIAAKMAAKAGADGSEFDVYASSDGVVVTMHDKKVDRTTNGTGDITAKTLAELRELDAGAWKDPRFAGERIPTLEEMLRALKGTGCMPVIEIKMPGISEKVVRAVRELDMVGEVAVIAFDGNVVREIRALEPRIPCAWLSSHKLSGTAAERADWIAAQAKLYNTDMVDVHYNMLSREVIAELKNRGIKVWCWTVDDPLIMEALMRWGVDSITTNRVETLVKLREKLTR